MNLAIRFLAMTFFLSCFAATAQAQTVRMLTGFPPGGYDPLRDFVPVAHIGGYDFALAIGTQVPTKDLREWLNWAKSDKKNAVFGSAGAGSGQHFLGVTLAQATGVPLANIPFRGEAPAQADLMAGQVPSAIISLGPVQHVRHGIRVS